MHGFTVTSLIYLIKLKHFAHGLFWNTGFLIPLEKSVYSNNSELITWLRSHQDKPIDVKELLVTAAAWPRFAHSLYRGPCSQNIALGGPLIS